MVRLKEVKMIEKKMQENGEEKGTFFFFFFFLTKTATLIFCGVY